MRCLPICAVIGLVLGMGASAAPFDCGSSRSDPQRNPDAIPFIDVGLAAVAASGQVHFSRCPGEGCSVKAYLVPGDVVVTGEARTGWTCVLFPNRQGGTTGWLPARTLKELTVGADSPLAAWTGKWLRDGDAEIEITPAGGALQVHGMAFWRGENPANIHDGEIAGRGTPQQGFLKLSDGNGEYDCRATLRLVGPYLLAEDNTRCGGLNVSFTGVYRRK